MAAVRIKELPQHIGERVTVNGWLYNKRTSGKLQFPIVRDGSGYLQCVVFKKEVSEETWKAVEEVTQESSVRVTGTVRAEQRAAGGVELGVESFEVVQLAQDYPITPKEHGTAFLMDLRHLWLRSSKQYAVLRVRNEIEKAIRDFFYDRDFVLIDSPILTANAAEGTSTLFETDYFGQKAYLSQSGQLYLEPAAAAFGRVYCFGPTFRAEKSKTRRHLMEFWMVEPEVAFLEFAGLQELA
ncbi:MAG TPA: amino acid--tRNA ligase-related protein, partial [Thermoanaerobaculia bacterium]